MTILQTMVDFPLSGFVAEIVWKSTFVLAIVWILHFTLLRGKPRWQVFFWRVGILTIVIGPTLSLILPPLHLEIAKVHPTQFNRLDPGNPSNPSEYSSSNQALPVNHPGTLEEFRSSISMREIFLVWLTPAIGLACWSLLQWLRLSRIIGKARSAPNNLSRELQEVASHLGIERPIELRICDDGLPPMLVRGFRPMILLPNRISTCSDEKNRKVIFAHELVHFISSDPQWSLLIRIAQCLFWFHPFIWRVRQVHESACETVCDLNTAQSVGGVPVYSRTLAEVALDLMDRGTPAFAQPLLRKSHIRARLDFWKGSGMAVRFLPVWNSSPSSFPVFSCRGLTRSTSHRLKSKLSGRSRSRRSRVYPGCSLIGKN